MDELIRISKEIRKRVLLMSHESKTSHVASALSCVDILVFLFFKFLKENDRFILSKGHGCMSYYAILSKLGYFPDSWLKQYSKNGGILGEHPPSHGVPGIEVATGSLGHGLSISVGCALARKINKKLGKEIVLLSDGECNEGTVWEAAMLAPNLKLDNIIAIVDKNNMQAAGFVDSFDLVSKWESFGWQTFIVDGNNLYGLDNIFSIILNFDFGKPVAIIANTIKGKGVSFMESNLLWHYKYPNDEELKLAFSDVENA